MAETTAAAQPITTDWVHGFVERWLAAVNSRRPERVLELMTDDVVYHDSGWPQTMCGHAETGEFLAWLWRAFPDATFECLGSPLVDLDGSRAAFWWRGRMTNRGSINPPGIRASGRSVEYEGADFHEYRDGQVARLRIVFDMNDVLRQLGLLPARGSLAEGVMVAMQVLGTRLRRS